MKLILEMANLNFHQPLIQSTVSHDPSEIILMLIWCSRNSSDYFKMLKTVVLYFCKNRNTFFSIHILIVSSEEHIKKTKIKYIHLTDPKLQNSSLKKLNIICYNIFTMVVLNRNDKTDVFKSPYVKV